LHNYTNTLLKNVKCVCWISRSQARRCYQSTFDADLRLPIDGLGRLRGIFAYRG